MRKPNFNHINGRFNYVVDQSGNLIVGRVFKNIGSGHIDLAGGEVRVVNGEIKHIDNSSGHYQPIGPSAQSVQRKVI